MLEETYKSLGFIIGFLFLIFILETFVGEQASYSLLVLTLISMILYNSNIINKILKNYNKGA